MHVTPESTGIFHFIGIGGIGMSGIAEILHKSGYTVRGSDLSENANVKRLRYLGVQIFVGQSAAQVESASVVVVSTAVREDNPELQAARQLGIPVVHRAEMLAEIMRLKPSIAIAGSHGKTTITSLLAHVMDVAGWDPTVVSGGIINTYGTNARLGAGKWVVAEADESDGSFIKLPATIAVVTSIDPEHMDYYKTTEVLHQSFSTFLSNIPFYGLGVLCVDHPVVCEFAKNFSERRQVTYGLSQDADVSAINIGMTARGASYDLKISGRATSLKGVRFDPHNSTFFAGFTLPMLGEHNVQNALAVTSVALELGIRPDVIRQGLATFEGVRRRFSKVGSAGGRTIVDDYGHHPVEISQTLKAARVATSGQVIAVVQPHRYSRLEDLFDDFCECCQDADIAIIGPVFAAGETPIPGIDHHQLVREMHKRGHPHVLAIDDSSELAPLVLEISRPGDYVICLGAGSVTQWAHELPKQMLTLEKELQATKKAV